jgi:hypothetical protein
MLKFIRETITAHKKLNEAVFAAYDWKSDLGDVEILENEFDECSNQLGRTIPGNWFIIYMPVVRVPPSP